MRYLYSQWFQSIQARNHCLRYILSPKNWSRKCIHQNKILVVLQYALRAHTGTKWLSSWGQMRKLFFRSGFVLVSRFDLGWGLYILRVGSTYSLTSLLGAMHRIYFANRFVDYQAWPIRHLYRYEHPFSTFKFVLQYGVVHHRCLIKWRDKIWQTSKLVIDGVKTTVAWPLEYNTQYISEPKREKIILLRSAAICHLEPRFQRC